MDKTTALSAKLMENRGKLLRYIDRHLPSKLRVGVDPLDVLQDTFFEAFRRLEQFEPNNNDEGGFERWLMTIARNRIVDLLRWHGAEKRGGSRVAAAEDLPSRSFIEMLDQIAALRRSPSQSAAAHEMVAAIEQCLAELPAPYQEAIRLRHFEGMTVREVAEATGRSEGSVQMTLARALSALRHRVRRFGAFV